MGVSHSTGTHWKPACDVMWGWGGGLQSVCQGLGRGLAFDTSPVWSRSAPTDLYPKCSSQSVELGSA